MTRPLKKIKLRFTTLEFFDSVVVSTVKEDVLFDEAEVKELREICRDHFGNKNFAYIANRKYNYNVNPLIYINLRTNTLKGIAIVSENIEKLQTANFEKQFSRVPFELFQNQEEALVWAESIIP